MFELCLHIITIAPVHHTRRVSSFDTCVQGAATAIIQRWENQANSANSTRHLNSNALNMFNRLALINTIPLIVKECRFNDKLCNSPKEMRK